jgi:hypothetical protein
MHPERRGTDVVDVGGPARSPRRRQRVIHRDDDVTGPAELPGDLGPVFDLVELAPAAAVDRQEGGPPARRHRPRRHVHVEPFDAAADVLIRKVEKDAAVTGRAPAG